MSGRRFRARTVKTPSILTSSVKTPASPVETPPVGMAVIQTLDTCNYSLPPLATLTTHHLNWSRSDMRASYSPSKWIDEDLYRTTILQLYSTTTENEVDEKLQRDALNLGLSPVQTPSQVDAMASSLSATTIDSEAHQGSIMSQSTAPTSCDSSERRPSTSLSTKSSRRISSFEMPTSMPDMERRRPYGLRNGLRKMTTFRKKKSSGSSTPSITSVRSTMTGTTMNGSLKSPPKGAPSINSRDSYSSRDSPVIKETLEPTPLVDEEALQRSMDSEQMMRVRTQQLDEKRRFLEYQTKLVSELLAEREEAKSRKRKLYEEQIAEQEDKNEKAVEELEARQLEEEMKQMKEHEGEKRAIQTRLKHMEAYCHTPSPPASPLQVNFHRGSIDSTITVPERHVTQQHYENLAQAYHIRDNMDDLHASKITVLRGKQKRALQNFMLKRESEVEQLEKEQQKELDAIHSDYGKQETEIRQEFEAKRIKLEARWKLQALIEKTRMEKSTGLKFECLPDIVAVES